MLQLPFFLVLLPRFLLQLPFFLVLLPRFVLRLPFFLVLLFPFVLLLPFFLVFLLRFVLLLLLLPDLLRLLPLPLQLVLDCGGHLLKNRCSRFAMRSARLG